MTCGGPGGPDNRPDAARGDDADAESGGATSSSNVQEPRDGVDVTIRSEPSGVSTGSDGEDRCRSKPG